MVSEVVATLTEEGGAVVHGMKRASKRRTKHVRRGQKHDAGGGRKPVVVYGCGIISVQDTLSDLMGRHYYENCYIEGAIDFIFGNGQSIFQRCEMSTERTPVDPGFITARAGQWDGRVKRVGSLFKDCTMGGVMPGHLW